MSFNPRVQKKNNIKYSQSHTNALLNLAQTQAAETVILENMLQKRLDKISKAKKRSKRGFRIGKVLSKIIPGKLDDAILGIASSAYADRQRSKAYGGIDTSQVSLLKDAAIEIDSQARDMSDKLMKDMKFSANAGKLISKKMMDQIAELPEIKKLKDKFSSLPVKEQLKPKNLFDFLKGSAEVSANFMKNPVGFMKRYERDPITKELQYKGTSALRKFFDSVIPAERERYQNEFNRLRKDAGLDMSFYSLLETPELDLQIRMPEGPQNRVDLPLFDLSFQEARGDFKVSAADVVNAENEALEVMVDGTLLADIKDAMPGEVVDSAASPELNNILNELVEEEGSADITQKDFSMKQSLLSGANFNLPEETRRFIENTPDSFFSAIDERITDEGGLGNKFNKQQRVETMLDFINSFGTYGPDNDDPNAVVKIQNAMDVYTRKMNEARGYKLNPQTGQYE